MERRFATIFACLMETFAEAPLTTPNAYRQVIAGLIAEHRGRRAFGSVYSAAWAQGSATPVSRASAAHRKSAIAPMPRPGSPASTSASGL